MGQMKRGGGGIGGFNFRRRTNGIGGSGFVFEMERGEK